MVAKFPVFAEVSFGGLESNAHHMGVVVDKLASDVSYEPGADGCVEANS